MSDNKTTKFTPAPWKSTFSIGKKKGIRAKGGFICFLTDVQHYNGQEERYEQELEESKANASLIAQAPAMYQHLEKLAAHFIHVNDPFLAREIEEILTAARGEKNP